MSHRRPKDIKRDRDCYLQMACLLRDCRDFNGYKIYLTHVEAMTRELNLRKYGSAVVF